MATKYRGAISILFALFCVFALSVGHILDSAPLVPGGTLFGLLFTLLFFLVFFAAIRVLKKEMLLPALVTGAILSAAIVLGAAHVSDPGTLRPFYLFVDFLGLLFLFTALLVLLEAYFPAINGLLYSKAPRLYGKIEQSVGAKTFFVLWGIILLIWIPAFLATCPGYYSYDGPLQIEMAVDYHLLDAANPLFHTLFLYGTFALGHALTGTYTAGLTIYCVTQALILSAAFSCFGCFVLRKRVPFLVVLLSLIFLSFNPIIQIFAFSTTKDVLFAAFFLFFCIFTLQVLQDPEWFYYKKRYMIAYVIAVLLMSLFRWQAIFLFVICVPFLLVSGRRYIKKGLVVFLTAAISTAIAVCVLNNLPHTNKKSAIAESISVPVQQIALVMSAAPETVTPEEKAMINKYLPDKAFEEFTPEISDYVKGRFNVDEFKKNPADFWKVWFSLGLKNKKYYAWSFMHGFIGYVYPSPATTNGWSGVLPFYSAGSVDIAQDSFLPGYYEYLRNADHGVVANLPIVSTLISNAFPFWVIIVTSFLLVTQKRRKMLIFPIIMLVYLVALFFGPVVTARYVLPLTVCVPLTVCLLFLDNTPPLPAEHKFITEKEEFPA